MTTAEGSRRLLLDTHALLWLAAGDARVPDPLERHLEDSSITLHLSIASIWEMAIKSGLGRLSLPSSLETFVSDQVQAMRLQILDITVRHALAVEVLEAHHRDPFDRLLVAQSLTDRIPLVTRDTAFRAYPIQTLWDIESERP